MSFTGKVVVITGAAAGIGKETARLFHQQGAKLALVDLNEKALEAVASELELEDYIAIAADVSEENQVERYVQVTVEKYGRIDVLFNNAGILGAFRKITDLTAEQFDQVLNVNVKGVFYGLKHVMAVMRKQKKGSIINTSSIGGLFGTPDMAAYVASKHAVMGLTKTAALEGADEGIRVNAICPFRVNTGMASSIDNQDKAPKVPLNRLCEPSEVGELVLFLASEKASFITGSCYRIDGGGGISV